MTEDSGSDKPQTELLTGVWEKRPELFTRRKTELTQFKLDELVSRVFSDGPHYHYVFDLFDLSLLYVSPEVENIHGLDAESVTFQDILQQIHPEDMDFVSRAEATAIRIFQQRIGIGKITDYKISYCFRFRVKDGSYHLFNHQAIVLSTDATGAIAKALNVHTDISHLAAENNYQLSLIGMNGEPSYLNIEVDGQLEAAQPSHPLFSKREVSVIRLVSQGLTSAEIAERLKLSEFTIKNHRKRILKKADCQNMNQLLGSCIVDGLI
ncbi:LuxR C-terminal-related transcriptional regulator [Microbulbifer bruguierae]|uniref:LuxR C-terminal-related transcriptional regulator n=1 Tax=Microbulbifer bruguierae TaxID=3029061 RepID=A0ABY8NAI5_9GAMM|nr:LuxR C-terminal-related transcriptional regulator [Microbulbifer bruguierae]WGL15597.1 LuxR C-terminal-related transcriptional regulator [Microbulbifer bruguierae]